MLWSHDAVSGWAGRRVSVERSVKERRGQQWKPSGGLKGTLSSLGRRELLAGLLTPRVTCPRAQRAGRGSMVYAAGAVEIKRQRSRGFQPLPCAWRTHKAPRPTDAYTFSGNPLPPYTASPVSLGDTRGTCSLEGPSALPRTPHFCPLLSVYPVPAPTRDLARS